MALADDSDDDIDGIVGVEVTDNNEEDVEDGNCVRLDVWVLVKFKDGTVQGAGSAERDRSSLGDSEAAAVTPTPAPTSSRKKKKERKPFPM